MVSGQILVVCDQHGSGDARSLAESILNRWPKSSAPTLRMADAEAVLAESAQPRVETVWIYAGPNFDRARLYELLDVVENWRIPTLVTRAGESQPIGTPLREGVIIAPSDSPAEQLHPLVSTLLCQGQMMRHVKAELSIMQRHHRGVMSQIDQLDEELRLAARIQRQFLPQRLPALGDVCFDVLFRPAGYVSGDIYDVQRLDENHLGFYVADAVGHGVPAALLTMFIKQALKTREVNAEGYRIVPPNEALALLNRNLLERQSSHTQFVTACYATFNVKTRKLRIARAGHPAPLLLRKSGDIQPLEPEGPLLGVFEDEPFELLEMTLDPGDRLLVYSDGFELAFGDPADSNQEHMDALHALREGELEQAMGRLSTRLDEQAGSLHQRDDMTALMLDINAETPSEADAADATEKTPRASVVTA